MSGLTRRAALAAGLAAAAPATAQVKGRRPLVIAHRGASGQLPEHTLSCYQLAIQQGADAIEVDLVVTKDGMLVARHENELSTTTDVAAKPQFARRRKARDVDGREVDGWFVEDFTLAELKLLRCRERLPQIRPANTKYDGAEAIPTLHQVVELARRESARTGRTIGLTLEIKHPTHFRALGLPVEGRLADALKVQGLDSRSAPVIVHAFDAAALQRFRKLSPVRRHQLVGADSPQMVTPAGLKAIKGYADGVNVDWRLILPASDEALAPATSLVADAHAAGLQLQAWTARAENAFLPNSLHRGSAPSDYGDLRALLRALYATGIDGIITDFPWAAVQVRGGG